MRTVVYITRHGLSEHNLSPEVYMGRSPAARLVDEGREQARRLGRRLARSAAVEYIVSSSLPRTMETARIVAAELGVEGIDGDDAFWELSKGTWEGRMPRENLPEPVQAALDADPFGFRYPQGESYRDVSQRAGAAFERWVGVYAGRRVLFVLHGDVIRALLQRLIGFPPERIGDFVIHPCSLTEFHLEQGHTRLVRFNDDSHLA